MEGAPKNLFNKAKESASSAGKKAILVGGLLLGVLGNQELKGQDVSSPAGTEQRDSIIRKEAEKEYEKLVAHRDSILEHNKMIAQVNSGVQKIASQIEALLLNREANFQQIEGLQNFIAPTNIVYNRKSDGITSSISSLFSGTHSVDFQNKLISDSYFIKEENLSFQDFIHNYDFKYGPVNSISQGPQLAQEFFNSYTDTKTNKSPQSSVMPERNAGIEVYGPLSVYEAGSQKPLEWNLADKKETDPHLALIVGKSNRLIASTYASYNTGSLHEEPIRLKSIVSKSDSDLTKPVTFPGALRFFVYKGNEPKHMKIRIIQQVSTNIINPENNSAHIVNINDVARGSWFDKYTKFICIPVWDPEPVPKLPNKDKFISNYASLHTPKDSIAASSQDTISKRDTTAANTDTLQKIDTIRKSIFEGKENDTLTNEKSDNYPRLKEVYIRQSAKKDSTGYKLDHYLDEKGNKIGLEKDRITPKVEPKKKKK